MAEINATPEGFEEEDAPDDVRDFLVANDIGDKYQIILKERPKEGGKALVLKTYTNHCPTIAEIGEHWGPGDYILAISYMTSGMNGVKKPTVKNMPLCLPERAWGEIHDEYLEKRREAKKEKQKKAWEEDAQRARTYGVNGVPNGPSEMDHLEKAIGILSKFGINPGSAARTNQKSFGEMLIEMAPVITALSPIILALFKKDGNDQNAQLLNTLVSNMLLQKPQTETESMRQMTGFLMTTMKQVLEMKEQMKPAEKESFAEKVFDKLVASGPIIASVLKMSAEQRQNNFIVKKVRESEEVRALHADPELQAMTIKRMDEFYGPEQTNQILSVMGFARQAAPTAPPAAPDPAPKGAEDSSPARDGVSGAAPMAGDGSGDGDDEDMNFGEG